MKVRVAVWGLLMLLPAVFTVSAVRAQEQKTEKRSLTEIAQDAIEKNMARVAQPGEQHELIAAMAGDWTFSGKMWMDPGAPPMEMSGTSSNKMILGGRFLMQEVKSEYQGAEFNGLGLVGFDRVTDKLQSVWIDNTGTAMLVTSGTCDTKAKVLTSYGSFKDPMKGEMQKIKSVTQMNGPDEIKDEMFLIMPDGKEVKNMEMIYKRK